MNEIFDIAPFAYVGENVHYKELTPEEKTELKEMKNRVLEKKENPTSEEVTENSASVNGPMIPVIGLSETEEPDIDNVFTDADTELLQEALEDELCGGEFYYEKAGFIDKIKGIFKNKNVTTINYAKVEKVAKAYTSLRMAGARLKVAVSQNPSIKNTSKHRDLQRKVVLAEKAYRKLKANLNTDESTLLSKYISEFDVTFNKTIDKQITDINDAKKAAVIKKEYVEDNAIIREYAKILNEDLVKYLTESGNIYCEGTNLRIRKKYRNDLKKFKSYTREVRANIRRHKYDDARNGLDKATKLMKDRKNDMLAELESIDEDSAWTAFCGWILRDFTILGRDILLILLIYPIAWVREWIDVIKDVINSVKSVMDKGYFSVSDLNRYTNFVKNDYDRMIRVLENLRTKIDDLEKDYKKETEEEDVKETAMFREYVEYLGEDITVLMESSNDVDIYYEGANWEVHKKYRDDLKEFKQYARNARKFMRANKFDDARKELKDAIEVVENRKKAMLKEIESIDNDDVLTSICGFIFRDITIWCRDILLILFIYPVAYVTLAIDIIKDIINAADAIRKRGHFSISDINRYTNFVKNDYDRMIRVLNTILKKVDDLEKDYNDELKKEETMKESVDIVLEKGIDPDMKPILDKLHAKGYKTQSSSSGHNNLVKKGDRNDNGVLDEYLYNDARLVFKGKYNLGKAPKYWYWKKVDNANEVEYLDIEQTKYKTQPGGPSNAFQDWKRKYMRSLEDWVDSLPNVSDKAEDVKESVEVKSFNEINEELDTMYESVLGDLMLDIMDI